jgi:hypothetical protein
MSVPQSEIPGAGPSKADQVHLTGCSFNDATDALPGK